MNKIKQVVNSPSVKWSPVDRIAKSVTAPANWIHKADAFGPKQLPPPIEQKKKKKRSPKKMADPTKYSGTREVSEVRTEMRNGEEFFNADDIVVKILERIAKSPQQLSQLARASLDARGVIDENIGALGRGMEDFTARVKVALDDLRQSRFAYVTETSHMLAPLREIRQFFLGKDYELEIKRLGEFVDLCERLDKLKQSGTLDAVADTMLRLA